MNNGPEYTQSEGGGSRELDERVLEPILREALARKDPPAGFTDRVMARALAGDIPATLQPAPAAAKGSLLHWPVRRFWAVGAVAATLILGLFEGETTYRRFRDEQRRIAEATAQFQTSERVTMRALAQAREQLQRAGVPLTSD